MSINKSLEPTEKKLLEVIDATPKWSEIVDILCGFIEHGNATQQIVAQEQLRKMARAADAYNAMQLKIDHELVDLGKLR